LIPEARCTVCASKRDTVIEGEGSADNIRASGPLSADKGRRHDRTHDPNQHVKESLDSERRPTAQIGVAGTVANYTLHQYPYSFSSVAFAQQNPGGSGFDVTDIVVTYTAQ
jgi:hypothetical protein